VIESSKKQEERIVQAKESSLDKNISSNILRPKNI